MTFRAIVIIITLATSLIISIRSAPADTPITLTTVTGSVTNGDSAPPVANAEITFTDGPEKAVVQSASDGSFSITLRPGIYRLTVQAKGFDVATRQAITISDQPIVIKIALVASGDLKTIASVSVRTQSAINLTPAAINSLTAQQIAAQGSIGLSRVLSEIPGVQITMVATGTTGVAIADEYAVNSPANPIYIGIRGSQAYENASLFDGHRLNSANWLSAMSTPGGISGVFNLANLDTNSIASLDVVKGPGADSPTDNNAIGGVANVVPVTATGKPSGVLSYGFDGSGGLQLNLSAQGETKNKRLGVSVSATSYTLAGPIGGFPEFVFDATPWGPYGVGVLSGGTLIGQVANSSLNNYSYLPHIAGGGSTVESSLIGCCFTQDTQDTTLQQRRSVSLFYNLSPVTQITLRYGLNNSLSNYSRTPCVNTFVAPPGYHGKYPNGYQFLASSFRSDPSREIDQLYEWDIHSQFGKGSVRASYLSYLSTNSSNNNFNSGIGPCVNCTLSGIGIIGGSFDLNTFSQVGGTQTVLNDRTVTLLSGAVLNPNLYAQSLTHDIVVDLSYPLSHATAADVSYNSTVTSAFNQCALFFGNPLVYGGGTFGAAATFFPGQFERFSTLRGSVNTMLAPNLEGRVSMYMNQYQYHLPNPADPISTRFINTFAYFTSPRFGFEWRPHSNIAIRASAGGGIAPIDISNLQGQNGTPQPSGGNPPTSYVIDLPNPNLKPETSFGEDIGMSLRIARVNTFSLDLYNTTLRGQFFTNCEIDGTYLGLPLHAVQTRNFAHSKYQGLELTYESRPPVGVFWSLQGSLQRGFAYDIPASFYSSPAGPYTTNLTTIANVNFGGVPYVQGFGTVGWENARGFQTSANFTYYGKNNGFYRPPFITIDLDGNVPLTRQVSLSIAVANLTNIYPSLYYQFGQYAIIPWVHVNPTNGFIGQTNTVQNVGPRHISANLNFKL